MSRIKLVVIAAVLLVIVIGAIPAAAANPNPATCLPACYASNIAAPDGLGTEKSLWKYNDTDAVSLRTLMRDAVKSKRPVSTLTVFNCATSQLTTCPAVQYTYTFAGDERATQLGDLPIPTTGVPVPTPYLLLGGVLLAALLVAAGLTLRFRARQIRA